VKLGVSLPDELVAFADEAARRRGTTRSGYLAELLAAERLREQVSQYIDRHGWDVAEDAEAWRRYQQRRMQEDYGGDDW
jgi:metal-responsive CopG/Arc/MetJ family transcriptional regulator